MSDQFMSLGPVERIQALKLIIASLSSYERAIARRELIRGGRKSDTRFDLVSSLPSDLVYRIFLLLRLSSLRACRQVNREWRQYATCERVVGDYVKKALTSTCIPPDIMGNQATFRWLEKREWRWETALPVFAKTVEVRGRINVLTTGSSWVAASCDGMLKAWHIEGGTLRLGLNIRAHTANRIAICASGRALIYSTFMLEARIYSLINGELLFGVTSTVSNIDHIDVHYDLAAIQKRNGTVEIYRWAEELLLVRFNLGEIKICGIKLCSDAFLLVTIDDWSVRVVDAKSGSMLFSWSAQSAIVSEFSTDGAPPRMKAAIFEGRPGILRVTLYNNAGLVSFSIIPEKWTVEIHNVCGVGACRQLRLLETHFSHQLIANYGALSDLSIKKPVACGVTGSSHSSKIAVPGTSTNISGTRKPIQCLPDASAIDDDIAVLGFVSTGICVLKFSE